jgi:hypothetical protein
MPKGIRNPPNPNTTTDLERAYLAGLFDGEGCISMYVYDPPSGWPVYHLDCVVKMCNSEGIDFIAYFYNGHRWIVLPKKKARQQYAIKLCQSEAARFLQDIRPFLRIKGPQADLAFQFMATFGPHNKRGRGKNGVPEEVALLRLQLIDFCQELKHA